LEVKAEINASAVTVVLAGVVVAGVVVAGVVAAGEVVVATGVVADEEVSEEAEPFEENNDVPLMAKITAAATTKTTIRTISKMVLPDVPPDRIGAFGPTYGYC